MGKVNFIIIVVVVVIIDHLLLTLAQVCINVAQCYTVAAQFEGCREKIQECSAIIRDLCRILYFKVNCLKLALFCGVCTYNKTNILYYY